MEKTAIEIRNLNYTYPDGTEVLRDINLDIFAGETVGIIGPNGAGKTTFLLHLNGILKGGTGLIRVSGLEMKDENLTQIRKKIGLIFQDPDDQLFMPTVFDDVAFGPINLNLKPGKVRERVRGALKKVDLLALAGRITHHLSFGEKKRVSIATVLAMDPEILVLDEPSSNLDPKSRADLRALLKKFDHTKIIAGHDLELIVDVCDRVVLLAKGKITAQGDTKEILSNETLMESHDLEVPLSLKKPAYSC